MPTIEHWRERAACRALDPENFFPQGSTGDVERQKRAAKAVCAPCPVAASCLAEALRFDSVDGIWGGLTAYERDVTYAQSIA